MAQASKFLNPHILLKMSEEEARSLLTAITYTIRANKDLGDNGMNVDLANLSGALNKAGVTM